MSEAIKALAKEHNIELKYRVLVIDTENRADEYIKTPMSEAEVRSFIQRNEKKLERCTIIGFSNIGTADGESRIIFKEYRSQPNKQAGKGIRKIADKEAVKKAREQLRKVIEEGMSLGAKPKR